MAMAAASWTLPASFGLLIRQKPKWVLTPLCGFSTQSPSPSRKLVLYTKPGCCLCDGLKEKLNAALSLATGSDNSLHDVQLQIRDISTNPEWERSYQYEIPVLARVLSDGNPSKIIPSSWS
ncbi:thioredoxin superfamily protein isoform X2 [Tasmannia lanceolata]|uniref:thioredoxin superfamily protein isoform X2 n=1 Tax=Tasmannia lanceolata TaxID=3420 RepID=UPI0040638F4D